MEGVHAQGTTQLQHTPAAGAADSLHQPHSQHLQQQQQQQAAPRMRLVDQVACVQARHPTLSGELIGTLQQHAAFLQTAGETGVYWPKYNHELSKTLRWAAGEPSSLVNICIIYTTHACTIFIVLAW